MLYRLQTSEKTKDALLQMKQTTNITPNHLCRYALSLSLLNPNSKLEFNYDNGGLEFQRQVLTGEYDILFKYLITQYENREVSDDEYFGKLLKAHIERGVGELYAEYQSAGNTEKFIKRLLSYEFGGDL